MFVCLDIKNKSIKVGGREADEEDVGVVKILLWKAKISAENFCGCGLIVYLSRFLHIVPISYLGEGA